MNTDKELLEELITYASMIEFLSYLKKKIPSSQHYKINTISKILKLTAKLVTCDPYREQDEIIDELNEELR